MARPREFDETEVLDRAMLVFWKRGYAGTSIADLVEATGLHRQSLYNTFGDKQALFLRALERYQERTRALAEPLRDPHAGLAALRSFVLGNVSDRHAKRCGGCMIAKTAFEPQAHDPTISDVVQRSVSATRRLLVQVLRQAQASGELISGADIGVVADYVFTLMNGLGTLVQTGTKRADVERLVDFALGHLTAAGPGISASPERSSAPP